MYLVSINNFVLSCPFCMYNYADIRRENRFFYSRFKKIKNNKCVIDEKLTFNFAFLKKCSQKIALSPPLDFFSYILKLVNVLLKYFGFHLPSCMHNTQCSHSAPPMFSFICYSI